MAPSATDVTGTNQTIESPSRSTRSSRLALAPIRLQRLNHIDGSEHVTRLTNQLRGALPFKQRQLGPHSVAGHRRMSGQETSSTTSHGSTKQRQSRNFTPRSAPHPHPLAPGGRITGNARTTNTRTHNSPIRFASLGLRDVGSGWKQAEDDVPFQKRPEFTANRRHPRETQRPTPGHLSSSLQTGTR